MPAPCRALLVLTVKDDALNLLEWVAWHRMIGFTDIVVYQNNSSDLTERTLRVLHQIGAVKYFPNDFRPDHPDPPFQNRAYRRASRLPDYAAAEWCMALDSDEFLNIRTPGGTLAALIATVPGADAIRVNWRVFGNSGLRRLDPRLQIERFTRAAPADLVLRRPVPVKTLFRTDAFRRPGIHQPAEPLRAPLHIVTGSGIPLDQVQVRSFQNSDPGGGQLAVVHHYMVRDSESYLMKAARGSSSHPDRQIRLRYWKKRNHNAAPCEDLLPRVPQVQAAMAELDRASGGRLARLRARSYRLWKDRIRQLRALPDYAALYDDLV